MEMARTSFRFFFVISFFSFPTRIPAAHFLFCVGRRTPDAGAETAAPMGRKKKNKRNAKTTFYRVRRCSISNKSTSLCLYTPTYYLLTYHLLLTYLLLTTYLPLVTYYLLTYPYLLLTYPYLLTSYYLLTLSYLLLT